MAHTFARSGSNFIASIHISYYFSCSTLFQDASLWTRNAKQENEHTPCFAESYWPRHSFTS